MEELRAELKDIVEDLRNEAVYCLYRYKHYVELDVPNVVSYFSGRLLQIKSMHNALVLALGFGADQWINYNSAEIIDVNVIIKDIEALEKL